MAEAVQVVGLRELIRAFRIANKEVARDIRTAIEQAGEPIRRDAQDLVRTNVSGMARSHIPWWTIRTGVERSTIGYIVPAQRGVRGRSKRSRPNLAPLIAAQEHAALEANESRVLDEFEQALDEVARAWARV